MTRVLFIAPRRDVDARIFLLISQDFLRGSVNVKTDRALQKIRSAKAGWYCGCVS